YGALIETPKSLNEPFLTKKSLKGLILYIVIIAVSIRNVDQAMAICAKQYCIRVCLMIVSSTCIFLSLKIKICFGFQYLSKIVKLINDAIAAVISGNSGPTKFDVRYCAKEKDKLATKIAGQVSLTPRQPSMIAMIQINTIGTIKGN